MRTIVVVLLLCLISSVPAHAQEKIDWQKNIEGSWKINYPKTTALALQGLQKEHAENLAMIPIASPTIKFSGKTIAFELFKDPKTFQFKSFDPKSNRIELVVENEGRESTIHFQAKDINTLVLDLPATILGPMQIVYSRAEAIGKGLPDSPLANLVGDWKLEEELTRSMWEKMIPEKAIKNYSNFAAAELSKTIQISYSQIFYSDQTFEPWEIKLHEGATTILQSTHRSQFNFEINEITENLIQIADSRRRMFAVYSRDTDEKNKAEVINEFPKNRISQMFLATFSTQPPRMRRDLAPRIGIDGNVEILGVKVERSQNADAVRGADIINMTIDLFLNSEVKHTSVMGGYLIDLIKLDDIYDNRGNLLSREDRRDSIQFLSGPTRPRSTYNRSNGRTGPSLPMRLDAPGLGATEIKQISGEVNLISYEPRLIRFENIGQQQNKPLKHPLLKGLDVRPKIENGQFSKFVLQVNQRDEEKILDWYLVTAKGEKLAPGSMGHGGGEISKGFSAPIPNDVTLVMEVVLEQSNQTMPFNFKNIKLR